MGERREEPGNHPERPYLTFQEAQTFLGVSHQTLYNLIKRGLPSHRLGRRRVFFKEELLDWLRRQ